MVTVLVSSRRVPPFAMSPYRLAAARPLVGLHREDGGGECGLAVVDVADGADVDVNLTRLHVTKLLSRNERLRLAGFPAQPRVRPFFHNE
jgi:hypothetical protein